MVADRPQFWKDFPLERSGVLFLICFGPLQHWSRALAWPDTPDEHDATPIAALLPRVLYRIEARREQHGGIRQDFGAGFLSQPPGVAGLEFNFQECRWSLDVARQERVN